MTEAEGTCCPKQWGGKGLKGCPEPASRGQAWDGLGSTWMAFQVEVPGANVRPFGKQRAASPVDPRKGR